MEYISILTSIISIIGVAITLYVNNKAANKREFRKELLAEVNICKVEITSIQRKSFEYYLKDGENANDLTLSLEITFQINNLVHRLQTLSENWPLIKTNSELNTFDESITGNDFQQKSRKALDNPNDELLLKIRQNTLNLYKALDKGFNESFPLPKKI